MGIVAKIKDVDFSGNLIKKINFIGGKPIKSLTANFNQTGDVYDTDTLNVLKQYLTVTAVYEDNTTGTITDYRLSGTLTVGYSTITASYGVFKATFIVEVTESAELLEIDATYTQGQQVVYNTDSLDVLRDNLVVVASYEGGVTRTLAKNIYNLVGALVVGTSTITVEYGGETDTIEVTVTESAIDPDAVAYCEAAGITTQSTIDKVNDFVSDLKDASIWDKMESIFPFMGIDKTSMMVNLKNPTATYPQPSLVEAETGLPPSGMPSLEFGDGYVKGAMNYYLNYLNSKMQSDGFSLNMRLSKETNEAELDWLSCLDGNSQGSGTGYVIFKNKATNSIDARSNITTFDFDSTSISTNILPSIFNYSIIVKQGMPVDAYIDGEKPTYLSTSGNSKLDYGRNSENDNPTKLCLGYGGTAWGGNIYFFSVGEGLTAQEATILSNAITALKA